MEIAIRVKDIEFRLVQGTKDDKPVFRHLMQLYKHDESEHNGIAPDSHGLFDYDYLDHYWTKHGIEQEGRLAFVVKAAGEIAGFALVTNYSSFLERGDHTRSLAEFFIMRKWRRRGIGKAVAHALFRHFPAHWEVKQERTNTAAQRFWQNAISEYTNGSFKHIESTPPGHDGYIQLFQSRS